MTREIKFRAWSLQQKTMYIPEGLNNPVVASSAEYMQYTGIKDKNGVEIYEGDILSGFNGEVKSEVVWGDDGDSGEAAWQTSGHRVDHDHGEFMTQAYMNNFEIIGNIYENPELLKKSAE